MNTILNFLKSLIFPTRMTKYRYMTVFISILIFVLSSSILAFPTKKVYEREKYNWIEKENALYLQSLTHADANDLVDLYASIKADGYKVEYNGSMYGITTAEREGVTKLENNELVYHYAYPVATYINEKGRKVNVHFIVDLFDRITDVNLTEKDKTKFNVKLFDTDAKYQATNEEDHIMIVLFSDALFYRVNAKEKNEKTGELLDVRQYSKSFWNNKFSFSTESFTSDPKATGMYLARLVMDGYSLSMTEFNAFLTFIFCVVYPLIIVLLFWLMFKRNGRLKTFKEYYNIAAISAVIPVVVMFVLLWFLPGIAQYFIFVFAAFYLYQIMKINSLPELV